MNVRQPVVKLVGCTAAIVAGLGTALLWLEQAAPPAPSTPGPKTRQSATERRPVTPRQLAATGGLTHQAVVPFTAFNQEGRQVRWPQLSDSLPVVFVFIKKGCPCSVEFEPYFHRLQQSYRNRAEFVGVIDGSVAEAREYAQANHVPYPILADPERQLIDQFHAENGAYVALVTADGQVDKFWPGCSDDMMHELGRRIAELTGVEEKAVDYTGMPKVLTSGCPFAS